MFDIFSSCPLDAPKIKMEKNIKINVKYWSSYGLNNNFTIYVFLTLAILPQTCDDFHRQKTFVLRILSFSPISVYFFFFLLSYRFVQLLSGLVREIKCMFSFFFFSKKCWERVGFAIA